MPCLVSSSSSIIIIIIMFFYCYVYFIVTNECIHSIDDSHSSSRGPRLQLLARPRRAAAVAGEGASSEVDADYRGGAVSIGQS